MAMRPSRVQPMFHRKFELEMCSFLWEMVLSGDGTLAVKVVVDSHNIYI